MIFLTVSYKDIIIGFRLQRSETKATRVKSIYGLPFVDDTFKHYEANAQCSATQKLWWIWFHEWFHRCKSRWLRKSDVRKVKALANHHHKEERQKKNLFSLFSTFNSCKWNEFIYINLHFVGLGERKQTYFCRFCRFFFSSMAISYFFLVIVI